MFLGQNSWNVRARILDLSYDRLRQERVKLDTHVFSLDGIQECFLWYPKPHDIRYIGLKIICTCRSRCFLQEY